MVQYSIMRFMGAFLLAAMCVFLSGCAKQAPVSEAAVCDMTKLAYQTPTSVNTLLGMHPHSDYSGIFDPSHRYTRYLEYGGSDDAPAIQVVFYHNQAVSVCVFFFKQQTPEETARRVGLNLSNFKTVKKDDWEMELTGRQDSLMYKSLYLTNISNQDKKGSWNIVAAFAEPAPVTSSLPNSALKK